MSDSTNPLDQIDRTAADSDVVANELVAALSPSAAYGRRASACVGLTWGYYGARYGGTLWPNGSFSLTAASTCYLVVDKATGEPSFSTSTTNWDNADDYLRVYRVVAGASSVTSWEDHRVGPNGVFGAGGSGGALSDGDYGDIQVSGSGTTMTIDSAVLSSFGRTLIDDANAAAARTTLGVDTAIAAAIAGLSWKQAVRVATVAAGTLATDFENGDTVDGVVLATGDRILIKNQSSGSENGIYTVNASGAPTRATDADAGAELVNASVYVSEGTANADTQWTCSTNAPITVGSTALTFAQLTAGSGSASYEVRGLNYTSSSSTGNADPGNGVMRWNNATRASVTELYLDNLTTDGVAISTFMGALAPSGLIFLQQSDDASRWEIYRRSARPSAQTGYYLITVTHLASGSAIQASKAVNILMTGEQAGSSCTASGTNAFVGGGASNTASGNNSTVTCGQGNTASGTWSEAAGSDCVASGSAGSARGSSASDRGIRGARAHASGAFSGGPVGAGQNLGVVLLAATTDATATRMTANRDSASATSQLALPSNSAFLVKGLVVARQDSTGDTKSWEFTAHIKRASTAGSTALVASVTPTVVAADAGASAWTVAVSADTTNAALAVTATGEAAKTLRWVCDLYSVQVVS